ncbi:aminomethyltransferase [Labrys miyagiensis]|uniref:Aminomethyltransferase n=1 Tax=Labrys miyagiensis TaxID=346912 RepID=A0ABQ6CJE7_9HYPH|nr:aminomethyltransferase family protein [Labrys miyagiensis]GLS18351.1 aminomethyltransferase [Labrys miyagiensis]
MPEAEMLRVTGGSSQVFALGKGDRLRVFDLEGGQNALLYAFGPKDALPASHPAAPRDALAGLIAANENAGATHHRLAGRDLASASGILVSGPQAEAGEALALAAEDEMTCVLIVPSTPSTADAVAPATDFALEIARSEQAPPASQPVPPLAEPLQDFRIKAATAERFEVKAGQYIQIMDIDGRQCSDFLAFDTELLGQGIECGLDATATRTIMGRAYPGPGLFSKFYDQRMRATVEVVQDTCGRHDTFGLACTMKYYDDQGYPGHDSCSENFNKVLAPVGIPSRPGWPAINFFFNTQVNHDGTIGADEPWSRPGDYVLLRALADLTCAASSCADDIDPANGWNPTDIQVRVYGAEHDFPKAIATRMTPDSPPVFTKETAFHSRVAPLSRRMVEYKGYWFANSFLADGAVAEYWACREKVAVIDLSALRKFEVLGPDAEALLDYAVTRDVTKLAVGQVVYTAICYPHGGMLDDGTVFRLGPQQFRLICGDPYVGAHLRQLAVEKCFKAWVRSSTDQLHNIAVQGPKSRDLLSKIVWTAPTQPAVTEIGVFRSTVGRLGDAQGPALVVSRTGYTGELGYEIFCHPRDGATLWDAVFATGKPLGVVPMGLEALDMLRIEAGLIFAGYEFMDEIDPFEAGIGFTVPLVSKKGDFVGREALVKRKAEPQRKLVGLEIEGRESAHHGDHVYAGRARIGVVTSGMRSPILDKTIALARVDVGSSAIGTEIEVGKLDGHQKRLKAKVVRFAHYDPDKTRVKM